MKRTLIALGLVSLLAAAAWGGAAANFSGSWLLDKSKSQGLPRQLENVESLTWVVTQTDKTISVESKAVAGGAERPSQTLTYNLDGSETTAELGGQMPGKATLKAKWMDDGKILELSAVEHRTMQGNEFTTTRSEHWELAEEGKVLKVHRKSESPRGTQESSYYFTKK
ncbi:MAG TPA: hypothetical protein VJH03_15710 [Blastocatellia bacterium]|nr:hypothetical protein [Blastocatellia bacterium]